MSGGRVCKDGQRRRLDGQLGHHVGGELETRLSKTVAVAIAQSNAPVMDAGSLTERVDLEQQLGRLAGLQATLVEPWFQAAAATLDFGHFYRIPAGIREP